MVPWAIIGEYTLPMVERRRDVTGLLRQITGGDGKAADELLPLVYTELRNLAGARMARERPGQTLQPTALVHEAYLRLVRDEHLQWENRRHFFAAAAEAMRRILVERARRVAARKHGGEVQRVPLEDGVLEDESRAPEILALDEALERLEARDPTMSGVVKLRYFAGLTVPETANALGLSARSVNRIWAEARAWLHREISRSSPEA